MAEDPTNPAGDPQAPANLPIRMLHDRVLVAPDAELGERKSSAGIVIPATAAVGKRLAWGVVAAVGPHVHQVKLGDKILFDPEDRSEVELEATAYTLLRERDVHAVSEPETETITGMYL